MHYDAIINWDKLKVGHTMRTGGIDYGPYHAVTCIAVGEQAVAMHVKGHMQYWGQSAHYIRATVYVFQKVEMDKYGHWICKKVLEHETGRKSWYWKAKAIHMVEELDSISDISNQTGEDSND